VCRTCNNYRPLFKCSLLGLCASRTFTARTCTGDLVNSFNHKHLFFWQKKTCTANKIIYDFERIYDRSCHIVRGNSWICANRNVFHVVMFFLVSNLWRRISAKGGFSRVWILFQFIGILFEKPLPLPKYWLCIIVTLHNINDKKITFYQTVCCICPSWKTWQSEFLIFLY